MSLFSNDPGYDASPRGAFFLPPLARASPGALGGALRASGARNTHQFNVKAGGPQGCHWTRVRAPFPPQWVRYGGGFQLYLEFYEAQLAWANFAALFQFALTPRSANAATCCTAATLRLEL